MTGRQKEEILAGRLWIELDDTGFVDDMNKVLGTYHEGSARFYGKKTNGGNDWVYNIGDIPDNAAVIKASDLFAPDPGPTELTLFLHPQITTDA